MRSVAIAVLLAQASFEVASVKATSANEPYPEIEVQPGGQFVASHSTLRELILYAYDLREFQLDGGADWTRSRRFDVTARAPQGADARQVRAMLQSLLRDRFGLRVRAETRTVSIYELTVSDRGGRLGSQLQRSAIDCTTTSDDGAGASEDCRPRRQVFAGKSGATITLARRGVSMPQLARILTPSAARMIVDKTGLPGTYDFTLSYSPDTAFYIVPGAGIQVAGENPDGVSLSSALRDQLGLSLQSTRGPGEVFVIESAAAPTEN